MILGPVVLHGQLWFHTVSDPRPRKTLRGVSHQGHLLLPPHLPHK